MNGVNVFPFNFEILPMFLILIFCVKLLKHCVNFFLKFNFFIPLISKATSLFKNVRIYIKEKHQIRLNQTFIRLLAPIEVQTLKRSLNFSNFGGTFAAE